MAARQCDYAFVCPIGMDDAAALATDFKARARQHGREIRVVAMVQPVWGASRDEAYAERQRVIDGMDVVAVRNWADGVGLESGSFSAQTLESFSFGAGSLPLLGTAADIADGLAELYTRGIDGVLMSYHDYLHDTTRFADEVVPLLKARGVV